MRLWTLHPRYLDSRGLVALWREALLAQAVLKGQTRGYIHHPQLTRFRDASSPLGSMTTYLQAIHIEARRRKYRFDATKITAEKNTELIVVTQGQLDYEWAHLSEKLRMRAPAWLTTVEAIASPDAHPLFLIVPGPVAKWEVVQASQSASAKAAETPRR
jgi:hypothetical protein